MCCLVVFSKRSYLGSCTLDHMNHGMQSKPVANVLLITTPGCQKRWLVFLLRSLHVSETRGGCPTCNSPLQCFVCVVQGSFPSILAENTLVRTVTRWSLIFGRSKLGSQHRSPLQNLSMSVLRGRLVSSCSSRPSNPCPHALSCHSSTVAPAVSLRVSYHRFQLFRRKRLNTGCAAGRQQVCEAFRMTATKIVSVCVPQGFSRLIPQVNNHD